MGVFGVRHAINSIAFVPCARVADEKFHARDLKTRINKHIKFHGLIVAKNENGWQSESNRKFNKLRITECYDGLMLVMVLSAYVNHTLHTETHKISNVKFSLNFWCVCCLNAKRKEYMIALHITLPLNLFDGT